MKGILKAYSQTLTSTSLLMKDSSEILVLLVIVSVAYLQWASCAGPSSPEGLCLAARLAGLDLPGWEPTGPGRTQLVHPMGSHCSTGPVGSLLGWRSR